MNAPVIRTANFTSEAGRWYDEHGQLVLEVPSADGSKMVKPDIRHARKLRLFPGTSSVLREAAMPPNLLKWHKKEAAMAALTFPRDPAWTEEDYFDRLIADAEETARKAREAGTAIHTAIQSHFQGREVDPLYRRYVDGALETLTNCFGECEWVAEEARTNPRLGVGTKTDLHSACGRFLVEWKGAEGTEAALLSRPLYDSHHMQLAAEAEILGLHKARRFIGYISRNHPGVVVLAESHKRQHARGLALFNAYLNVWIVRNEYDPRIAA